MAHRIDLRCIGCADCMDGCPVDAISMGQPFVISPQICIDCGACAMVCPADAIHFEPAHQYREDQLDEPSTVQGNTNRI